MAYIFSMVIIETSVFTRCIQALMSDDDYAELQALLVDHLERGDVIPRSGGLRKVRYKLPGRGKRGGARIIYYWLNQDAELWMLYAYAKTQQEDLTPKQLRLLREIVERWTDDDR
jgi:hypothetical protein